MSGSGSVEGAKVQKRVFCEDVFAGEVVVISGGGSGIGLGITRAFMQHGADTVIFSRSLERVQQAAKTLEQETGRKCLALSADVRDPEAVNGVIDQVLEKFGHFEVLINAAAGNFLCSADKLSRNAYKTVLEIDTVGTWNCTKAAYEKWFKAHGGNILNITMTLHWTGSPLVVHACAAKAANDATSLSLANEWGRLGIRVNSIAPGPIEDTEGLSRLMPAEFKEMYRRMIPMQRFGRSSDVADAALFLASPASSYITGTIVTVDGGSWTVGNGPLTMALAKM